jgi:quercetin dioxygenase-like cupin family protein
LSREPRDWRIRISKLASTPLPRVLLNTTDLATSAAAREVTGAAWKLGVRERDLDSNVIALPPNGAIEAHAGPNLDVLVHVLAGSGRLVSESGALDIAPGDLVWLPRRSQRAFTAGSDGLRYLTVHQARQALVVEAAVRRGGPTPRSVATPSPEPAS